MKLVILFFLGLSFAQDSTLSAASMNIGGTTVQWDAPVFVLQGGCRGIRADSRGDGAYGAPRDGGASRHWGIDWAAPVGTVIVSPWPGRVEASKPNGSGGAGGFIQILHSNGLTTTYAHLNERYVRTGDTVQAGQRIGTVGQTGNAGRSHPHLHFTLRYGGTPINPTQPGTLRCASYAASSLPEKRTAGIPVCTRQTNCP